MSTCSNPACGKPCRNKFCSVRCFNTGRVRPHLRYPDNEEKRLLRSRKRPFESLHHNLQYWATRRGTEVDLSYEEFLEFTKVVVCHYCGDPIDWTGRDYNWRKSFKSGHFLDRKDNTLGYSKDNCVVCCKDCNFGKGDRFSYDEWKVMTAALREFRSIKV